MQEVIDDFFFATVDTELIRVETAEHSLYLCSQSCTDDKCGQALCAQLTYTEENGRTREKLDRGREA